MVHAVKVKSVILFVLFILFFSCSNAQETNTGNTGENSAFKKLPREAYRGEVEELITEAPEEEAAPFNMDSLVRYIPSRGVSAMPGTITVSVAESEANYQFKVFGRLPVELSLYTEYTAIKNTTQVELPAYLTGLSAGIETTLPFFRFDRTYLRLKASPSYYGDDWSLRSSAFRIPAQTFLIYQMDDKWTFVAGVAVYPDYENTVWPILGVIYKPNERLSFNFVPERPNINYKVNEQLSLFAELGVITTSEYEVTKDDLKNVVLRYNESRAGAGAKYKFNKYVESSLSVGGVFNRSLKYRDSYGKVVIKDGFYSEFRVNVYL